MFTPFDKPTEEKPYGRYHNQHVNKPKNNTVQESSGVISPTAPTWGSVGQRRKANKNSKNQ
jgi:hypothetical protein